MWTSLSALFQSDSWERTGLFSYVVLAMSFFTSLPTNQIRTSVKWGGLWFWLLSDHFMQTHFSFGRGGSFIFLENKLYKSVLLKCKDSILKLWSQIKNNLKTSDSEALWNGGKISPLAYYFILHLYIIELF